MQVAHREVLRDHLSRAQVQVSQVSYAPIWPFWNEASDIPDYNRLYLITEGEACVGVNGRDIIARVGDLCLLPAGHIISYSRVPAQPLTKYWLHFTATIGDVSLFDVLQSPRHVVSSPLSVTQPIFERTLTSYLGEHPASSLATRAGTLELLSCFLGAFPAEQLQVASVPLQEMYPLLEYINAHLAEDLGLQVLAQLMHLHPNYFTRYFRRMMGVSPMNYVQQKRVEKAKNLLTLSSLSLTQIAEQTGFADPAHFSNVLRKHLGMPPTEYRKLVQQFVTPPVR